MKTAGTLRALAVLFAWLLCAQINHPAWAEDRPADAHANTESAGRFVQAFLNWYVKDALGHGAWKAVRSQKSAWFSPQLVRALDEDDAVRANANGISVGLNFDPFLFTQDPEDRYQVGRVVCKGHACLVDIHGVRNETPQSRVGVVAEVKRASDGWRFVNFHYETGRDLLTVLRILHDDREHAVRNAR